MREGLKESFDMDISSYSDCKIDLTDLIKHDSRKMNMYIDYKEFNS
jgi:hypothetical protein